MLDEEQELFIDTWWTLVLPIICVSSLLSNLFNSAVLSRLNKRSNSSSCSTTDFKHSHNSIYQLMHISSIIRSLYLFICAWIFLDKCGQFCLRPAWPHWPFVVQLYKFYAYGFAASVLLFCDLLLEVSIAVKRLCLIVNGENESPESAAGVYLKLSRCGIYVSTRMLVVIAMSVSIAVYSPTLFFIAVTRSESIYQLDIVNPYAYAVVQTIATAFLRTLLLLVLLVLFNVANCRQLSSKMKALESLQANACNAIVVGGGEVRTRIQRDGSKFKEMLLFQSLVYLLGNSLGIILGATMLVLEGGLKHPFYPFIGLITNTAQFFALGLNSLMLLCFDKKFRQQSFELFATPSIFRIDDDIDIELENVTNHSQREI